MLCLKIQTNDTPWTINSVIEERLGTKNYIDCLDAMVFFCLPCNIYFFFNKHNDIITYFTKRGGVGPNNLSNPSTFYWSACTKAVVMHMCLLKGSDFGSVSAIYDWNLELFRQYVFSPDSSFFNDVTYFHFVFNFFFFFFYFITFYKLQLSSEYETT